MRFEVIEETVLFKKKCGKSYEIMEKKVRKKKRRKMMMRRRKKKL